MIVEKVRADGSRSVALSFPENEPSSRSRTKQSFKKDADVNNIMIRYRKTGVVPTTGAVALYGDFSSQAEFNNVLARITRAQEAFLTLPADVRKRFNNDVAEMLDFVADDANYEEAVKLKVRPVDAVKEEAKRLAMVKQGDDINKKVKEGTA